MSTKTLKGTALEKVGDAWGESTDYKYHGFVYTSSLRKLIDALGDERIVKLQASRNHRFNRETTGIAGGDHDEYFTASQTKTVEIRVDYSRPIDQVPFDSSPIFKFMDNNPEVADLSVKEVTYVLEGGDLADRFKEFVKQYPAPDYTTDRFYVTLHSSLGHERTRDNLKKRIMEKHPDWYWQKPTEDEKRGLDWVPRILAHHATFSEPAFKEGNSAGSARPIITGSDRNWTALEFEQETVSPIISDDIFANDQFHTIEPGFSQSNVCINAALRPFGSSMYDLFRYRQAEEEGWALDSE